MNVNFYCPFILLAISLSVNAQRVIKVKRKGVQPIVVIKAPDKAAYSLEQFSGRWQEISRKDRKTNSQVDFNDTLFYYFSGGNKVYSRDGVSMSLIGEADIDGGNVLTAAADVFTIKSFNGKQVVLDDGDEYIHTLVKKNNFWNETLPTNSVVPEKFTIPIVINSSSLMGKWKVYKRDALPGRKTGDMLIRMINITNSNDKTASGEVTFYKDQKFTTLPCTIILSGEKMQIISEAHKWNMNVYKADGKDLVFGDPSLMYYCKPI